jgi:hypothetical protein
MPGLQQLIREAARRCRGIQPRNAAVPCIFALSCCCRPRYRSLVTPSDSAPPPHSPNKLVSTSVLSRILMQAPTQPGNSRRRPWPGSCSIRGQRDLACSRFPTSPIYSSASSTVDRGIVRRSAIPATPPRPSRITECLSISLTLFQLLGTRHTVINACRSVVV